MKPHQTITVCLALVAGVAADGCFAQTAISQQSAPAPQDPAVVATAATLAPPVSVGKTREQVMRELEEYQNSDRAAQMQALYRGGN
jgi:hypothetical protein